MNQKTSHSSPVPLGFTGALLIAFVVLKLTGVIDWSWLWVLSPAWIPLVVAIVLFALFLSAAVVAGLGAALTAAVSHRSRPRTPPSSDPREWALHGPVRKWGYRPVDVERLRGRATRHGPDPTSPPNRGDGHERGTDR
jgi:hypothetical protein